MSVVFVLWLLFMMNVWFVLLVWKFWLFVGNMRLMIVLVFVSRKLVDVCWFVVFVGLG